LFQDCTSTNKSVNEFDFSSLDLDKPMFSLEDHTMILMKADNLLRTAKCQLLDLQLGITFEEEQSKVNSDESTQQRQDLISATAQGIESDFKVITSTCPP